MPSNDQTGLEAIGARLSALSERLAALPRIDREHWVEVGALLLEARVAHGDNDKAFGKWIRESGADRMPGLKTPSARSAVIWMAQYPERVAVVGPETARSPKRIRTAWRDAVKAAAGRLAPQIVAGRLTEAEALGQLCHATAATEAEARPLLSIAVENARQAAPDMPAAPSASHADAAGIITDQPEPESDAATGSPGFADIADDAAAAPAFSAAAGNDEGVPAGRVIIPTPVGTLPLDAALSAIVACHGLETVRLALDAIGEGETGNSRDHVDREPDPEEPDRWRGVDLHRPMGRITVMDVRKIILDACDHDLRRDGMLLDLDGFDAETWAPRTKPSPLDGLLDEAARKLTARFLQDGDDEDDEAREAAFEEAEATLADALRKAGVVTAPHLAEWPREPSADFVTALLDEGAPEEPLRILWPGWFERRERKAAFIEKHGKTAWEAVRLARLMTSRG